MGKINSFLEEKHKYVFLILLLIFTVAYYMLGSSLQSSFDLLVKNHPEYKDISPKIGMIVGWLLMVVFILSIETKNIKSLIRSILIAVIGTISIYSTYNLKSKNLDNKIKIQTMQTTISEITSN